MLHPQASELAGWRLYFRLDERLAAWSARHEAAVAAGPAAGGQEAAEALAAEGGDLLQTLLEELVGWRQCTVLQSVVALAMRKCTLPKWLFHSL